MGAGRRPLHATLDVYFSVGGEVRARDVDELLQACVAAVAGELEARGLRATVSVDLELGADRSRS